MRATVAGVALYICLLMPPVAWSAESSASDVIIDAGAALILGSLEITETVLNRMVDKLGIRSFTGYGQAFEQGRDSLAFDICDAAKGEIFDIGDLDCPRGLGRDIDIGFGGKVHLVGCVTHGGEVFTIPVGDPVPLRWWITDAEFTVQSSGVTFTATVHFQVKAEQPIAVTDQAAAEIRFDENASRLFIEVKDFKVPISAEVEGRSRRIHTVDVGKLYSLSVPIDHLEFTVPVPDGTEKTVTARINQTSTSLATGKIVVHITGVEVTSE